MQKSMKRTLVDEVQQRISDLGTTQQAVARACNVSQGHLSKVLSGQTPLATKMEGRLRQWLSDSKTASTDPDELLKLVDRITEGTPARRMYFMHFLRTLEDLVRKA